MKKITLYLLAGSALLVAGCAKDDMLRTEGLTLGAGDALATNTALQVIDPWPTGVEDTDLVTPSDRRKPDAGDAGSAPIAPAPATP